MKNLLIVIFTVCLFIAQPCFAKELKVLVLPDTLVNKVNDAFVYPEASELISNDIIKYLNEVRGFNAPQVSTVKEVLKNNERTNYVVKNMMKNFKYNYNIDFEVLNRLNRHFSADMALLITTNLDVQNYFLRRTFWDFCNIPGATVIDPAYRLSTQVYLIDIKNKKMLWQDTYQKLISSRETRMVSVDYAPQAEQMERIKMYSEKFLAPQITQELQLIAYKVDEFTDLNLHPEIVKTHPVSIDSFKVNTRRGSVMAGRHIKKKSKETAEAIKTETKGFVSDVKAKNEALKQERAKKKAEKEALKQENKLKQEQVKQQGMLSKIKNFFVKDNNVLPDENVDNIQKINNELPQREIDVILIKEEPKFEDVEFVPVKPRQTDNLYMINDL